MNTINVYNYLDYRTLLRDMFEFRKKANKNFSYRFFARKAGFSSPNFIKLVIDGLRNVTKESISKIAIGFELNKGEREFFENMVYMNQADSHEEKNFFYRKMTACRGYAKIHRMDKNMYEYYSKWYYPVVREVLVFGDRKMTAAQVAECLNPAIKEKEAERAIALLENLGFITKDNQGCWQQSENLLSTGPQVRSLAVSNFHREMIRLGAESIERVPREDRDITALTLRISSDKFDDVKEAIAGLRKELLNMAVESEEPDQVLQVNFQAFPVAMEESKPVNEQEKQQ